jgi:F420-dependent oxidoreductase-like protein
MKFGILIEAEEGLTWARWRHLAATVERLGFESLWLSDHFISNVDPRRDALETWVTLAVTAAETTRIRFGPLVCPMSFRHPALLARMAAAVDVLSGGRLILGLGAGWNDREHRAFGLPFPALKERLDRLEEGIEVIRRLLGDGPASFAGQHFRLEGADPRPKPVGRPRLPLLIGGGGERRTLGLVARYADEWDVPGGLSPNAYRAKCERLAEHCRAIGRDPREIRRSASTAYLIGRDEAELRRRARRIQRLIPDLAGLEAATVLETLRASGWRIGTPAQLIAEFRALGAAGADRVILQHNDQSDDDALELLAEEVLPAAG